MKIRRAKEDRERQEQFIRDIRDLPPLEPLEEYTEDDQVPSTSGMSSIIRTIVRTPSWEREESVAARPEYGEDDRGKGKGGKGGGRWVKKGEVVKFGEVMNKKDKELLEARVKIVRAE